MRFDADFGVEFGFDAVAAADYTLWRNSLGQTGSGLAADGNGNGVVDAADYTVWKNNFGATSGSGGLAAGSVPEPTGLTLLALAAVFAPWMRVRRS